MSTAASSRSAATARRITIEPGGQIELSGEQCETIHCAHREFTQHVAAVDRNRPSDRRDGPRPRDAAGQPHRRNRTAAEGPLPHHVSVHGAQGTPRPAHDEADRRRPGQSRLQRRGRRDPQAAREHGDRSAALRDLRQFADCDGALNGFQSFRGHIWTDTDATAAASRLSSFARTPASRITPSTRSTCRCTSSSATTTTSI